MLATALALLGFSVVAAILLMRTRLRAAGKRGAAARRQSGPASPGRPVSRAVVRRAPDPDRVGGRRQSPANQRRYFAAAGAGFASAIVAAHPRLRNLAAARAGAADGPCGRRAARGRRGFSAQSDDLQRTRAGGHGPGDRRPGHCADSRTQRIAAGTRRNQPAAQGAAGRNRDAARFHRRGTLAGLDQARQRRSRLRQCRLCAGDRRRQRRRRDRSQPRTARQRRPHRHGPRLAGYRGLHRAAADRGGRRAAGLRRACDECRRRKRRRCHRRLRGHRAEGGAGADGGGASAHARSIVVRGGRVRRPAPPRVLQ